MKTRFLNFIFCGLALAASLRLPAETTVIPGALKVGGVLFGNSTNYIVRSDEKVLLSKTNWTLAATTNALGTVASYYRSTLKSDAPPPAPAAFMTIEMSVDGSTYEAARPTNVTVYLRAIGTIGWTINGDIIGLNRPDVMGATNKTLTEFLQVDYPSHDEDATPRSYVDAMGADDSQWSTFPAAAPVRLGTYPLKLAENWELLSPGGNDLKLRFSGNNVLTFTGGAGTYGGYLWITNNGTQVLLTVSNGVAMYPVLLQTATTLISPTWSSVTGGTWSTNGANTVYTFTPANAPGVPAYYRVLAAATPTATMSGNLEVTGTFTVNGAAVGGSQTNIPLASVTNAQNLHLLSTNNAANLTNGGVNLLTAAAKAQFQPASATLSNLVNGASNQYAGSFSEPLVLHGLADWLFDILPGGGNLLTLNQVGASGVFKFADNGTFTANYLLGDLSLCTNMPAAGVVGTLPAVVVNNSLAQLTNRIEFHDDFLAGDGSVNGGLYWNLQGTAGSVLNLSVGEGLNRWGVRQLRTTAVSGQLYSYATAYGENSDGTLPIGVFSNWQSDIVFKLVNTTSVGHYFGFLRRIGDQSSLASGVISGQYLRYDTGAGDTNWVVYYRDASNASKTNWITTAQATPDTNWHVLSFYSWTAGNIVTAMDGVPLCTNTFQTAVADAIFVCCITRENVAKTNMVDYIGFRMPK